MGSLLLGELARRSRLCRLLEVGGFEAGNVGDDSPRDAVFQHLGSIFQLAIQLALSLQGLEEVRLRQCRLHGLDPFLFFLIQSTQNVPLLSAASNNGTAVPSRLHDGGGSVLRRAGFPPSRE